MSRRSVDRLVGWLLGLSGLARACTRGDGSAHTHTGSTRGGAQSQLCTPTRTAFIHKSCESGRDPRAAPHRALLSPRPVFYERNVRRRLSRVCTRAYSLSRTHVRTHVRTRGFTVTERNCVLIAAIAIDARSKFKRTYFPDRGGARRALRYYYTSRASS